ncbi:CRISPR-associated endonuclease Cas2 [Methanobrevibacter arboriphilus]|uniref:CRISPR-associated endonuclease Cas2 n=1 Tax=Methanobrevibacter arboriphilus TaxID=39441 RepID=A0ACA8R278_METAZ|nr:CRISPR-associated endonuclease Cas2 [Methanobrevibacter arboriphilus]BBL61675.1 CRISPR-associated endonuclease Cas2 [Methanobrevibacter arboriphilus]GLI12453.1 CRISPR-associated endonuclease Cas2 [Methanobrevibacter arboriphilus]
MYLIIVYDIKVERVNKVKSFLRQYLYWIQNSVFEGEATKSEYNLIASGLNDIININEDSIIIYKLRLEEAMQREILGIEKSPIEGIL